MSDRQEARHRLEETLERIRTRAARSTVQRTPLWEEPSIKAAMDHAPDAWKDTVVATVERLARQLETFTADDVWGELAKLGDGGTLVCEPRTLGPILLECARRGVIRATADYAPSTRRRGAPVKVWRSPLAA